MERSEYLTPPEAAVIMMCSALHVRSLIKQRKLPVYFVGRRAYIPRNAVYEYISTMTTPADIHDQSK